MKTYSPRFYVAVSLATLCLFVLAAALIFAAGLILAPQLTGVAQAAPAILAESDDEILAAYENALGHIYETSVASVVKVTVTQGSDQGSNFGTPPHDFPLPEGPDGFSFPRQGQGSGFVWDKAGHIVTNFHVIQGAEEVEVLFEDGARLEAEVVGTDPDADLAVIKVDPAGSELQPIPLGDSDELRVGQLTVAIGAPFGQDFTMTSGIVSAVGRTLRSGNSPFSTPEAIQTDAPINPGNSGGPLINRQGEVIGINTQILSRSGSSSGIGFAVPINIAKRVVPTLIKGQVYEYAWLGISGYDLPEEVAGLMNLPADTKGALIAAVVEDGPAEEAGLLGSEQTETIDGQPFRFGGDVITAIDGQPIEGINDVIVYLVDETRPGDEIIVTVLRADGEEVDISVTLGARPNN